MSHEATKRTSSFLLGSVILFCVLNMLGLMYLYHTQQVETVKLDALKPNLKMALNSSMQVIQNQQNQINQELQTIQKKLNKPHHAQTNLLQIKWLIQQAKWQLNILYRPDAAIHLLRFAAIISQKNQWDALNDALLQDINHIQTLQLTAPELLIQHIDTIKTAILTISPKLELKAQSKPQTHLAKFVDTFKPFIQIEKIHQQQAKVVPPTEQVIILQNMLLLLPQIQFAGISHNQELFKALLTELQNQWLLIANQTPSPMLTETLEKLNTMQFIIDKPIALESFGATIHLSQQLNAREPK